MQSRRWMRSALAFLTLGIAMPAFAQRITGEVLLEVCLARQARITDFRAGLCLGTISGALDTHDALLPPEESLYCLGQRRISNDDVVKVVVDWLQKNPKQQSRPAGMAVVFAMRGAFPCAAADASAPKH